jgi:hypothetical protein
VRKELFAQHYFYERKFLIFNLKKSSENIDRSSLAKSKRKTLNNSQKSATHEGSIPQVYR